MHEICSTGDRDRDLPIGDPAGTEPISSNDLEISPGHFRPIESTSFLLECKVPRNGGMVYWLKNGKAIPNPPVTRNMDLVMSPVQRRDSGLYTCVSEDRRTAYQAAVDVIPDNINSAFLCTIQNNFIQGNFKFPPIYAPLTFKINFK